MVLQTAIKNSLPTIPTFAEQAVELANCGYSMRRDDLPKEGSIARRVYDYLMGQSQYPTAAEVAKVMGITIGQAGSALSQLRSAGLIERLPGRNKISPSRWRIFERNNHGH